MDQERQQNSNAAHIALFGTDHFFSLSDLSENVYLNLEPPFSYQLFEDRGPEKIKIHSKQLDLPINLDDKVQQYLETDFMSKNIYKKPYHLETRADKLSRYRFKKGIRIWKKKVSYACRQKVANHRARVKGKFVSVKSIESTIASPGKKEKDISMPAQVNFEKPKTT